MSIMYHRNGDYLLPDMGLNETDKTMAYCVFWFTRRRLYANIIKKSY